MKRPLSRLRCKSPRKRNARAKAAGIRYLRFSDASERQERNGVRAARMYMEARMEMMRWWSNYLDVSREDVAPYIYAWQHSVYLELMNADCRMSKPGLCHSRNGHLFAAATVSCRYELTF